MADSEPLLRSLGISLKAPFDWGDQPRSDFRERPDSPTSTSVASTNHRSSNNSPSLASGLDLLKTFVQTGNNCPEVFLLPNRAASEGTHDESTKSDREELKGVLRSLLAGSDVTIPSTPSVPLDAAKQANERLQHFIHGDTLRDVSIRGLSDRAVAELTVECKSSLFGSILRLFDSEHNLSAGDGNNINEFDDYTDDYEDDSSDERGNVDEEDISEVIANEPILSTAEIVRTCHLTTRPGDVPPGMDSKEYTMAALHFLSSHVPFLSENDVEYLSSSNGSTLSSSSYEGWETLRTTLPVLPLLRATNPSESLEKRCYGRVRPLIKLPSTNEALRQHSHQRRRRKKSPDSMDHNFVFRIKVLNLERIFSSSLPFSPASLVYPSTSPFDLYPNCHNSTPHAFQKYVARRKLCPHLEEGVKEELSLMISGHLQQHQLSSSTSASISGKGKGNNNSFSHDTTTSTHAPSPGLGKSKSGVGKSNTEKKVDGRGLNDALMYGENETNMMPQMVTSGEFSEAPKRKLSGDNFNTFSTKKSNFGDPSDIDL